MFIELVKETQEIDKNVDLMIPHKLNMRIKQALTDDVMLLVKEDDLI